MARPVVLVTGLSGLIGSAFRRHLADGAYELRALNRRAVPGVQCHQADIADLDAIEPAFAALVEGRYAEVPSVPMLTHESPLHPSGIYGASKVWGEALGRHYADAHGLSVLCVRIGRVTREDRPQVPREFTVWCSQRDIA